ncbi:MAG: cache domain-containing protein [Acidobacteriota bacterium]
MKKRALVALTAVLWMLLIATVGSYFLEKGRIQDSARRQAQGKAEAAAQTIDGRLEQVFKVHRGLVDSFARRDFTEEALDRTLCDTLVKTQILFGVGTAFKPRRFSPDKELFAPYCRELPGQVDSEGKPAIELVQVEDSYDYTGPENDWYHLPLMQEKDIWQEPHHGRSSEAWIVNITSPLKSAADPHEDIGVGYSSLSLGKLRELMGSLELGQKGYSYLVSRKGTVIVHPKESFIGESLSEIAKASGDAGLKKVAASLGSKQAGYFDHYDALTGERSWVFHLPIATTGWTLAVNFFQEEMAADLAKLHALRPLLVLQTVALALWMAWLLWGARRRELDEPSYGRVSVAATVVLVVGAVTLVALHQSSSHGGTDEIVMMTSEEGMEEFLSDYETLTEKLGKSPSIRLPTGLFVQSMGFSGANDVALTGYVWQRYTESMLEELRPGFVFPEAIKHKVQEVFSRQEGDEKVFGWYFETTLRQRFDYSQYPFDAKQIWVRIWHRDFDKNVVLVPDLGAYQLTNPNSKPGLEEELVTKDWLVAQSFFGYKQHSYSTDFGLDSYTGQDAFPELYFNILAKRESWGALTVHFILLAVVAVMLFAMLSSITSEEKKKAWIGFSFLSLLGGASGLFFVMNVAHTRLRGEVPENLVFLEWFYLVMYLVIVTTAVTGFGVASGAGPRLLTYRDCLIPKLVYWPLLASYAFVVSFVFFGLNP